MPRERLRKKPAEPTRARAGSKEKVRALRLRYARGEELWDENDNPELVDPEDDEPPPRTPPVYSLPARRRAA